jgi:disulfide bond formation protein DsbB
MTQLPDGLASAFRIGTLLTPPETRRGNAGDETAMTQAKMTKQTWIGWIAAEPAAAAALAVFAIAGATLAGAWYFQLVVGLPPCPLCLEERIAYHVIIPLSLLMAIAAACRAPATLLMVGFIVIFVAAVCNVVLGSYHAGVEWHLWAGPADCTGPLSSLTTGGSLLSQLQSVHVVQCDVAAWRFLGISLAGYNVLISLLLAAIAAFGLVARKPAP